MTPSILPPSRYNELPLPPDYQMGEGSVVVVLEDAEGIKGFWIAQPVIHIEPVWLSPSIRDGGLNALKMYAALLALLGSQGVQNYYAFSDTPQVSDYLKRLGLEALPYEVYHGIVPPLHKE